MISHHGPDTDAVGTRNPDPDARSLFLQEAHKRDDIVDRVAGQG